MNWFLAFSLGLFVCFLAGYTAGRADILRGVWKRVSGREGVKFTLMFERLVGEGEAYPRGYGFAYYNAYMDEKVAYPVPLNMIARVARRIYLWYLERFVGGARGFSRLDVMLLEVRWQGKTEGYAKGKADGLEETIREIFSPDQLRRIAVSAFENANAEVAMNEMADAYEAGDPDGKLLKAAVAAFRGEIPGTEKPNDTDNPPS